MSGKLIAIPGGGSPYIPRLVLEYCDEIRPNVLLIPAASGDNHGVARGSAAMWHQCGVENVAALWLWDRQVRDIHRALNNFHIVWVDGGNTVNLCAVLRAHGVDVALKAFLDRGGIIAGVSAGALCWFSHGLTDSYGPGIEDSPWNQFHAGLGFIDGYFSPHYDDENRRRIFRNMLADVATREPDMRGWAGDDDTAFVFKDGKLFEVVQFKQGAQTFLYHTRNGAVAENQPKARQRWKRSAVARRVPANS